MVIKPKGNQGAWGTDSAWGTDISSTSELIASNRQKTSRIPTDRRANIASNQQNTSRIPTEWAMGSISRSVDVAETGRRLPRAFQTTTFEPNPSNPAPRPDFGDILSPASDRHIGSPPPPSLPPMLQDWTTHLANYYSISWETPGPRSCEDSPPSWDPPGDSNADDMCDPMGFSFCGLDDVDYAVLHIGDAINPPSLSRVSTATLVPEQESGHRGSRESGSSSSDRGYRNPPPTIRWPCKECDKEFQDETARNKHLRYHSRPFLCPLEGCLARFSVAKDLRRHYNTRSHIGQGIKELMCSEKGCSFKYNEYRKDSYRRHLRLIHGLSPGRVIRGGGSKCTRATL
ncbi:hypothetical protein QBC39DRAFT_351429 [Podospora conica]|nr:hypothetical protein QBC39DRAFT_351429 [Schizothecium conicum]